MAMGRWRVTFRFYQIIIMIAVKQSRENKRMNSSLSRSSAARLSELNFEFGLEQKSQ
eukprot:gene2238-1398_t